MTGNLIEQQALDFANVPIIQRGVRASVHLEDWEDVLFWDTIIQRTHPGRYNYLAYSKAEGGQRASGSSQCMKYVGYTSSRFFVCVDSDLDYLMQTPSMDASRFVAQTYTYSWENHYAQSDGLQQRLSAVLPLLQFDIRSFLAQYSKTTYRPLLALLWCLRNKDNRLTRRAFATCLPHQCKAVELRNGGEEILQKMERDLTDLLDRSGVLAEVDMEAEAKRYAALGVTEDNAYLHVRGHNLYDLLRSMGRQLCSAHQVDFDNHVLNASLPETNHYWQLTRVSDDLTQILNPSPPAVYPKPVAESTEVVEGQPGSNDNEK